VAPPDVLSALEAADGADAVRVAVHRLFPSAAIGREVLAVIDYNVSLLGPHSATECLEFAHSSSSRRRDRNGWTPRRAAVAFIRASALETLAALRHQACLVYGFASHVQDLSFRPSGSGSADAAPSKMIKLSIKNTTAHATVSRGAYDGGGGGGGDAGDGGGSDGGTTTPSAVEYAAGAERSPQSLLVPLLLSASRRLAMQGEKREERKVHSSGGAAAAAAAAAFDGCSHCGRTVGMMDTPYWSRRGGKAFCSAVCKQRSREAE
jgi:hypothetical protein